MDRATRALSLAEDGNAMIERLRRTVTERTTAVAIAGTTKNGATSFGEVAALGGQAAIAAFSGESATLMFCGKAVATGGSPILAVLPFGTGELKLSGVRDNATALLIGIAE